MSTREVNTMDEQRAANAIGIEMIPGTEIMRDVDGAHFAHVKGSHGAVYVFTCSSSFRDPKRADTIRLIPHPSSSKSDPLNWSPTWKSKRATQRTSTGILGLTTPQSLSQCLSSSTCGLE